MRRFAAVVLALVASCERATSAPAVKAPPAGTVGVCSAAAQVANVDADHQPAAISGCPSPLELTRGNGLGSSPTTPVTKAATPAWDLAGARAFACAYACAADGAQVAMLGWSTLADARPLRNDYAAFEVSEPVAHRWTVIAMWRHAFNPWWNIGGGVHDRAVPIRTFTHAPTAAELDAMLTDARWPLAGHESFALLGGHMIDENWPSPPLHRFPAGTEP